MFGKIEHIIEVVIFRSRWLLAPFFLGLIVGIILLLIKFIQELVHLSTHVITATDTDIIIGIL
ncbi:MAG: YqhA family protein, partial [Nitrospinae bacterium]|nr:YqhA family protein [Nitrospinota bacterium]